MKNILPEFCTLVRALLQRALGPWFYETRCEESSPLLGGAEAKGFGVGVATRNPPRRCAPPLPKRGFSSKHPLTRKIQVLSFPLFAMIFLAAASIVSNDAPRWPMFQKHLLDAGANEAATVADINKDGRLDIVSG